MKKITKTNIMFTGMILIYIIMIFVIGESVHALGIQF